jgi:uncharacterized protein (TIGR02246 family)
MTAAIATNYGEEGEMSNVETATVDTAALLERVERLEARATIRELMADYAHGCDEQDADRFMRIWHDDAVYKIGDASREVGVEDIRKRLDAIWEMSPETRHWITDITVDFESSDRATGNAHTICFVKNSAGEQGLCSAWYDNVYTERDGVWKIAECDLTVHWFKNVQFDDSQLG